jgi:photosystem II stability/assembly factor-like uncharacterized protein
MQSVARCGSEYTCRVVVGVLMVMVVFLSSSLVSCVPVAQQKTQQHLKKKPAYNDLFSVAFPTEKDGWACGRWGTTVHTSDGGATWEFQASGTDYTLSDIHFVDPMTGWAVGDGGTIIHTTDGGKTWVKQKSPVPYWLTGIQFVNARRGWIVAERTTILHTEDGGQSWQVQFKDEDYVLKRVSFCDEKNGWAAGEYGLIYHTDNGGKTWQRQAGGFEMSPITLDIVAGNLLFDVVAVNPKVAWVVGIEGYISRTQDGGKTWLTLAGSSLPKKHLFAVYVDKQGTILTGGNALLLRSADGGKSFAEMKIEPRITYSWFYRIMPRRGAGFVAVGRDGLIYLSDNKGAIWKRVVY